MTDQTALAHFAVGFATGLVVVSALLHVRVFLIAVLTGLAVAVVYVLHQDGVPGLTARSAAVIDHLRAYVGFYEGLLFGKVAAGLVRLRIGRRP